MYDLTCCFEPTFTFMGFLHCLLDVRPPIAVEGRRQIAVTHLALLGVKISGPAFWGLHKRNLIRYISVGSCSGATSLFVMATSQMYTVLAQGNI